MITEAETLQTLIAAIADVFMTDAASLNAGSTAADVPGWDSVSQVMLIMRIEDDFRITLETNDINEARNIGALANVISSRQVA